MRVGVEPGTLWNQVGKPTLTMEWWDAGQGRGSMPDERKRQQATPLGDFDREGLAQARAMLQDPGQVAPVDAEKFGKRFAEILLQARARNPASSQD